MQKVTLPLPTGRIEACSTSGRCFVAPVQASRRDVMSSLLAGGMLLAAAPAAQARPPTLNKEADAASSPYIQELLKRSRDNKQQYDRERLDSYYKKNFKDYFEYDAGSSRTGRARGIKPETQAAIDLWLQENK